MEWVTRDWMSGAVTVPFTIHVADDLDGLDLAQRDRCIQVNHTSLHTIVKFK